MSPNSAQRSPENRNSESIVAHIVTFNHAASIEQCVRAIIGDGELHVHITDNCSSDGTIEVLHQLKSEFPQITLVLNNANLGFCAANNNAINTFLVSSHEYFLLLNPDVVVMPECVVHLRSALQKDWMAGSATPKLLRCDEAGNPITPATIDAAGMMMTRELRHLDCGSNQEDYAQFERAGKVFGGTGACLLLRRALIQDLLLPSGPLDAILGEIYPATKDGLETRRQLLDEAFFAYREDADLAWRAQRFGWRCRYVPRAVAYHARRVLPEKRAKLPKELNRMSVRNRFLLQLNNYCPSTAWGAFLEGFLLRNALVVAGVVVKERSSMDAFRDLRLLLPRALALRRYLKSRATNGISRWFEQEIE